MAPKETFARLLLLPALLSALLTDIRAQEPGNNFDVVEASFRKGDSVEVKSLRRVNSGITLLVSYVLGSEEQAMLHFLIAGDSSARPTLDPRQRASIKRGQGTVMLHYPHASPGLPCITLNHSTTREILGHIYFGSPQDVAVAKMPGLGWSAGGGSKSSAKPSGMVEVKLARIILPRVGCENASPAELFEYLSIQSRGYDPTTHDARLKGLPIMVTSKRKDSLALSMDLQNVPLGEAIRHAAKLGGLSVTYTDTGVVIGDLDEGAQTSPATEAPQQPHVGTVADRASRIIFPAVRVENVSTEEIIEFIRAKSRDLDPDKTGIEINVKPGAGSDAIINLDLKNIPLSELLLYVAELCRCNLIAEANGYVLTPRS